MNYFAFGLTLETELNLSTILPQSDAPTDVFIEEGDIREPAGQLTRIQRRGVRAKFGKAGADFILNWEGIGKFRISEGKRITYQNLGADEGTLRLFLLSEVIGIILYQRGLFLLHASAVAVQNQAIVFLGIPGAGKSTTATAFGKAGYTILSDDLVAIKLVDSSPYVVPAFSQYKVWKNALIGLNIDSSTLSPSFEGIDKFLIMQPLDTFPKELIPLRQINIVFPPASRIKESPINPIQAPIELIKHFPVPIQLLTQTYLQQHFLQALAIGRSTPIHFMKRPKDFQALELYVKGFAE